jgi:hypothetical protein
MRITEDGLFVRTDIWREGKWVDLWSVVHFLSGMTMGFVASFSNFSRSPAIIIVFLLLVAYEMFEALVKIKETPQNRFMDVVVGMASFLPMYLLITPRLAGDNFALAFLFIFTLNTTLALFGWTASRKAFVLEQKLRAEYEKGRAKITARIKRHGRRG